MAEGAMSPTDLATEPPQVALTPEQLDDLAKLLAQTVVRGNLARLATVLMGPSAQQEAGNEIGDLATFARRIVEALNAAGRIPDAVGLLRQEAHRNSRLTAGLNYILRGGRFGDDAAAQKFVNEYEPLLSSATFQERFPGLSRTVCAVGLGKPIDSIVGSGFLIAPDLVMTNYHVIEPFLEVRPDGTIGSQESGEKIYFFFDYLWEPAPKAPFGTVKHASVAVQAAEKDWLVYARGRLPFDGTPQCTARSLTDVDNRYDYAVVRLARPVGRLPVRPSGGPDRGWLLLPGEDLGMLEGQRRIIVFQHPGRAPQQFDIGDYVQMDLSGTRVWYSVSTAKGSSGGAAVDTDGRLVALHNAEVEGGPAGQRLNQGVRIDYIAKDLAAKVPGWRVIPLPNEDALAFWSLNDNPLEPQPIIGRTRFRENVLAMTGVTGTSAERLLVVSGPPGSGRRFSIDLLRRTLGAQTPVVEFSPKDLSKLLPRQLVQALAGELNILGLAGKPPIPEPQSTEAIPRWLRGDLPRWLRDRLEEDKARNPARYPVWVVINTAMPEGERLFWAENLKDFFAALVGVRDPGQEAVEHPHLRFLLLGSTSDALPVSGVPRFEEDLASADTYPQDFVTCLRRAWRSLDKTSDLGDDEPWRKAARREVARDADKSPVRKLLADFVRELLPSGGGD
jgi:S1-C subfamily serine protease